MCSFFTLIGPETDAGRLRQLMERHGRSASPTNNPTVAAVLQSDEQQFLTTSGHCDCGTVLGSTSEGKSRFEGKITREVARWERKGWSETKIARAVEDQRKAEVRPRTAAPDSLALWKAVLEDLRVRLGLKHAGLFVNVDAEPIGGEVFDAPRREIDRKVPQLDALAAMKADEVTIFPLC